MLQQNALIGRTVKLPCGDECEIVDCFQTIVRFPPRLVRMVTLVRDGYLTEMELERLPLLPKESQRSGGS